MRRFPLRTLVLMLLALAAFFWMWLNTRRPAPALRPPSARVIDVVPLSPPDASR
jgi:hypothetical protein